MVGTLRPRPASSEFEADLGYGSSTTLDREVLKNQVLESGFERQATVVNRISEVFQERLKLVTAESQALQKLLD